MNLPEEYLERMKQLLKDRYQLYLDCFDRAPVSSLRVNTSKISADDFLKITPFKLRPVPWCSSGFYYDESDSPSTHPHYYAGLYYIQEASAMAPGAFLPMEENDIILDVCSAPGGKATAIASRMPSSCLLVSNDISVSRQYATLRNLERAGAANIMVISEDTDKLASKYPETFSKILVDAPCSGEGMFRKDHSLISHWSVDSEKEYSERQKKIITDCARMLAPGGMLLYSTCTFSPLENEETVHYLLDKCPDMSLVPISHPLFEPGISGEAVARLYPFNLDGEGHFLALFRKAGNKAYSYSNVIQKSASDNEYLNTFLKDSSFSLPGKKIITQKDQLLAVDPRFDNYVIRTLRSGLLLGTVKHQQFVPSQPLAMAMRMDQFANCVNLSSDDIRVRKYLRGETIEADCSNGWALIGVDGCPLGWGKASKGKIKNQIDPSWRML